MTRKNCGVGVRVFLVDDHEIVRRGLRDLFDSSDGIDVVGEAGTIHEALVRIPLVEPEVAVVDLQLPDGSGIDLCRALRKTMPRLRTVVLTAHGDIESQVDAALVGALGFTLKQVRGNAIVDAVRAASQGISTIDPEVRALALDRLRLDDEHHELLHSLTPPERSILELIAEGRSNREIAHELHYAEKTIKNRVTTLFSKLGVERRAEAAVYAARVQERYGELRTSSHH